MERTGTNEGFKVTYQKVTTLDDLGLVVKTRQVSSAACPAWGFSYTAADRDGRIFTSDDEGVRFRLPEFERAHPSDATAADLDRAHTDVIAGLRDGSLTLDGGKAERTRLVQDIRREARDAKSDLTLRARRLKDDVEQQIVAWSREDDERERASRATLTQAAAELEAMVSAVSRAVGVSDEKADEKADVTAYMLNREFTRRAAALSTRRAALRSIGEQLIEAREMAGRKRIERWSATTRQAVLAPGLTVNEVSETRAAQPALPAVNQMLPRFTLAQLEAEVEALRAG